VYGVKITATTGYRHPAPSGGVATGSQPEGMYMVASGTNVNDLCCFDFGNVEAQEVDDGAGAMDAVAVARMCGFPPCTGPGPWVEADLENGVFQGNGSNPNNLGNATRFVTAMLKNNGTTNFTLKGADATTGGLTTWYSGSLPSGYSPMRLEGSIVMGSGGDNSQWDIGSFFEGVMTSGFPTDAADNAVQSNIVSAGYSGNSGAGPGGTITLSGGKCVDVAGDDTGSNATFVQVWDCQSQAADQHWTHNPDDTLTTLGRCMDVTNNGTAPGSKIQLWDCNGCGCQKWVTQSNGSLLNPQSGLCLDDPSGNTTNGTQLQIWTCNGFTPQVFHVNGGGPIIIGTSGKCIDTAGLDIQSNGRAEQVFDCQRYAADQHWYHAWDNTLRTFGVSGPGTS
jgi:hypothetical protein